MRMHLICSEEMPKEGGPITGLCGAEIPITKFIMRDWVLELPPSTIMFCPKCFGILRKSPESEKRVFVTGVVNAESALHKQD